MRSVQSIQSIIFIRLFAIIIIFFGVVSAVAYFLTSESIRQFVVSDATTSLSFVINNIETNYKGDLMALDEMADMEGFSPFDEKLARQVIRQFLEFQNVFSTVHMYRVDGEMVFQERRASMAPYTAKHNFRDKSKEFVAMADKVIQTKHSMASEVLFTGAGALYQTYLTPVFADRKKEVVYGILSGGVFPRLQRIDHLLEGLRLGQDNFILITDSNGNFITSDGITEKVLKSEQAKTISAHIKNAALNFFGPNHAAANKPFLNHHVKVDHYSFIAMSLPIIELKLVVTLGVNTHRIDEKQRELSYRLLAALLLGLLFSLFASVFVGERLSKPFREMARTINEINIGNFATRVNYTANDEIGDLCERINALAEKIQKSEYLGNLWSNEVEMQEQLKPGGKERKE